MQKKIRTAGHNMVEQIHHDILDLWVCEHASEPSVYQPTTRWVEYAKSEELLLLKYRNLS